MIKFSSAIPIIIISSVTTITPVPSVVALEAAQISAKAKEFVVQIGGDSDGSGVIIERQGKIYTVLTNCHVVANTGNYQVTTFDNQQYPVNSSKTQCLPGLDLAKIEFNANQNYTPASLGDSGKISEGTTVYLVGYPAPFPGVPERSYLFMPSQIVSRLSKSELGYELLYNNYAPPGTSGGAVLDNNGKLVGINGRSVSNGNNFATFGQGIPLQRYVAALNNPSPASNTRPSMVIPNNDFVSLGKEKAKKKDYQGAVALYDKALSENSNNYEAYYERAAAYYKLKNYKAAIKDLNRVLKINPNDAAAYFRRGYSKNEIGDKKGAIEDYTSALRLNSNDENAYGNRGNLYDDLKEYDKALSDYNKAIEINPQYASAYNNRGSLYGSLKEYDKALTDFNQAIRLDPKLATPYYNRGLTYRDLGEKSKALSDFQQAAKLYQQQGLQQDYQNALDRIRELQ